MPGVPAGALHAAPYHRVTDRRRQQSATTHTHTHTYRADRVPAALFTVESRSLKEEEGDALHLRDRRVLGEGNFCVSLTR